MKKKHYIEQLIEKGEGLTLDFKFEVSDAAKIARSLVAFANTEGEIKGITSEEEFYMLENAARRFCIPEVKFTTKEWNVAGKKVLQVTIPRGEKLPHKAPDHNGKYKAFIRYNDNNILAHAVQVKVWQKQYHDHAVSFYYTSEMQEFLNIFNEKEYIEYSKIAEQTHMLRSQLINTLANLVAMKTLKMITTEINTLFALSDDPG